MNPAETVAAEGQRNLLQMPRRLVAAVVAAGVLVSGCISGSDKKTEAPDIGGLAAFGTMDQLTAGLYAEALVTAELDNVRPDSAFQDDIDQADRIIEAAGPHLNSPIRLRFTKMLHARAGEVYLGDIGGDIQSDPNFDPRTTLPAVAPSEEATLLNTVAEAVTAQKVDQALSQDPSDPKRFAAARRIVATSHNPSAAQRELLRYIDGEQVDAIFQDFTEYSGDPGIALRAIGTLHDPALKQAALADFQATLGESLLNRLNLQEITLGQAQAVAGKYLASRPDIRAAIDAWAAPYEYVTDSPDPDLETQFYNAESRLQKVRGGLPQEVPDFVQQETDLLDTTYTRTAAEVDGLLGKMVTAHNRLASDGRRTPAGLAPVGIDPRTPIDLTGVSGQQTGLDVGKFAPSSNGEGTIYNPNELPVYNEFAAVTVEKGELVLNFHDNDKLSDEAKKLITIAFNHVRPLLTAAFKSGELQRVRLTIADDFDPYFHSMTREEIMALPADNSTSVEQLAAAWTHETVHSLVRNVFQGNTLNAQQTALVLQACTALKTTLYERLQTTITASHDKLAAVAAEVKSAHRVIITELEQLAASGRLDGTLLQSLSFGRYGNVNANDCEAADTVLADAIQVIAAEHHIDTDDLDYMYYLPSFRKFAGDYYTQVIDRDIYKQLNEANYVRTDWYGRELLGHSEDNANELSATVMDEVLNFGPEFGAIIRDMDPDEKKAALQTIDMAAGIVLAQHPELTGIVMDAVVRTKKAAKATT